jgi:hypothetical protein
MGWLWVSLWVSLLFGYGLAMGWLWVGYGLAMGWLWVGYGLVMGWLWVGYGLAIGWLWAGYGLAMGWLLVGYWLVMLSNSPHSRQNLFVHGKNKKSNETQQSNRCCMTS